MTRVGSQRHKKKYILYRFKFIVKNPEAWFHLYSEKFCTLNYIMSPVIPGKRFSQTRLQSVIIVS
jgi:hypothetical protein